MSEINFKVLNDDAKYIFVNKDMSRHDAQFLGQEVFGFGDERSSCAWAAVPSLKEVIEFCPQNVIDENNLIIIFDYERRHSFERVLKDLADNSIFWSAKNRGKMFNKVRMLNLLL